MVKSTGGQGSRGLQEYIKYSGPKSGSSNHNTNTHLSHTTIQPQLNLYYDKPPLNIFSCLSPSFPLLFYMMSLYSINHNSATLSCIFHCSITFYDVIIFHQPQLSQFYSFSTHSFVPFPSMNHKSAILGSHS